MDPFAELESMAAAAEADLDLPEIEHVTHRWQLLFDYSEAEAEQKILKQRQEFGLVSQALWESVQEEQVDLGHDRETYSHWLELSRQPVKQAVVDAMLDDGENLLQLAGPLTAAVIQEITGTSKLPTILHGDSEDSAKADFVRIDSATKHKILSWLSLNAPAFRPTFVALSIAPKNLSSDSICPTLGKDATLPQHRLSGPNETPRPGQDEYPVWYFFYGTLADEDFLATKLGLASVEIVLASMSGGRLGRKGVYKALADHSGPGKGEAIEGKAFLVQSSEQEDALRYHETKAYEVVRCEIRMQDGKLVPGCTFRFRGLVDE